MVPLAVAGPASADQVSDFCQGISQASGQNCGDSKDPNHPTATTSNNAITNMMRAAANIISIVAGFFAVIMIIVAGLRFMTAGGSPVGQRSGDPNQVKSARSALTYAVIGIIIVALAQIIVRFTINRAVGGEINYATSSNPSATAKDANCPTGMNPVKILKGQDAGEWYCK